MKKFILIEPHKFYSGPVFPPMALLYVAAAIDPRPDLEWEIVDYNIGGRADPYLDDPEVVAFGITSLTGDQLASAMKIARKIKARRPEVPVVWGGIHVSSDPDACLREEVVDIIVPGECENILNQLLDCLIGGRSLDEVPGILYKKDGRSQRNDPPPPADLSKLRPLPFERVDLPRYERSLLYLNTSRGCPHRCDFCCSAVDRLKWRAMPPELVAEHLAHYLEAVGPRRVFFSDYNFFLDMKRALAIAAEMVSRNARVPWTAHMVAADVKKLNASSLLLLRGSGLASVVSGQDGSERLMPVVGKSSTHREVGDAQQVLKGAGVSMTINYILGLPGETAEDLDSVVRDIKQREDRGGELNIYIFSAWPGTPILGKLDERQFSVPADMAGWSDILLGNAEVLGFHSARHKQRVQTLYYVICLLNGRHIQWFTGAPGPFIEAARRVLLFAARRRWAHEFFDLGVEALALHWLVKRGRQKQRRLRLAEI